VGEPTEGASGALDALNRRASRARVPVWALWELTHRCPLACRHCYLEGAREGAELDARETDLLLRELADAGTVFLVLSGGDPLVRDDFLDVVDRARELGFAWKVLTSGMLVDDAMADAIAARLPLEVSMSLHGLRRAHDEIASRPGAFDAVLGAARRLIARGVRVLLKTVVTPAGAGDVAAVRDLCDRLGARHVVSTRHIPGFDGGEAQDPFCLSDAQLAGQLDGGASAPVGPHRLLRPDEALCNAGRSALAISPRGDVRACLLMREVCGNVRETPLSEIWRGEAMRRLAGLVAGGRARCASCADAAFCSYCPGLAEAETGDPLVPAEAICREARLRRERYEARA